ncbi:MAG TPA: hypothetical protein VFJ50_01910 [Gemmatimonadales bacterium]|nr:hypothetical protein [Gemmatimonadales bacterium]
MATYTPEQRAIIARIKRIGREVGATPKEIKAALETGRVEANFTNPSGGDADSAGWRQERASLYSNPTNLDASIRRFFRETSGVRGQYGTAGALAAAVQRPAAQYRGRYQGVSAEAQRLLGGAPSTRSSGGSSATPGSTTRTVTTTTPGVDNRVARAALIQSFLEDKRADPVDFAVQANALKDIPATTKTKTVRVPGQPGSASSAGTSGGGGASSALNWVQSKLGDPGSRETGGPNQGRLASYLNSRFGMSGQPWCAMFTSAAVTKGGAPPSARTASVAEVRAKAQRGEGYVRGFIHPGEARPGDLVLFGNRHIAMVKSVRGGRITYIGGNQSNTVSQGQTGAGGVTIVRPKYGARR